MDKKKYFKKRTVPKTKLQAVCELQTAAQWLAGLREEELCVFRKIVTDLRAAGKSPDFIAREIFNTMKDELQNFVDFNEQWGEFFVDSK